MDPTQAAKKLAMSNVETKTPLVRAFVAVLLPDEVRKSLVTVANTLRQGAGRASWVRQENLHLTLRFLGNVERPALENLAQTLRTQYTATSPVVLRLKGTGTFPNLRRPSVVWAGLEVLSGDLNLWRTLAEDAARQIGLAPEKKGFHPHITLARIRDPRHIGALPEQLKKTSSLKGDAFTASAVSLLESKLTPKGAVYRRLWEFPCNDGDE